MGTNTNRKRIKITIIGLGYVGLPLAIAIEKSGNYDLTGFDIDDAKIRRINKQETILEDALVRKELKKYPIKATKSENALRDQDIYIIAVPTPVSENHIPNYGPVESASKMVGKFLKKGATVVLESTVNPGTCEEIVLPILEKQSKLKGVRKDGGSDFNLSHCPERINPGDPKWTVYNIPRNIGSLNPIRNKEIADFYRDILNAEVNEVSSLKIAESTKIIENTFRDINIAYVNELAKSFDKMGIDLVETIKAASNKPFGYMPHWPGAGVGGHCIAVDPYYLIGRAAKAGFDHKFLKQARQINNSMPAYTVARLQEGIKEAGLSIEEIKVAVLGLAYKANVADLRESPSFDIIAHLEKEKINYLKFDPFFPEESDGTTLDEVLQNSDAIILATAHKQFLSLTAEKIKSFDVKVVVDGRNILDKHGIENSHIIYKGIGR